MSEKKSVGFRPENPVTNLFPFEFKKTPIFRSLVEITVHQTNGRKINWSLPRDHINQQDNEYVVRKALMEISLEKEKNGEQFCDLFAYDKAQLLFTPEEIKTTQSFSVADLPDLSEAAKGTLIRFEGTVFITIYPDTNLPSFVLDLKKMNSDPNMLTFLNVVTSQCAISENAYIGTRSGLLIKSKADPTGPGSWHERHDAVHKQCKVVSRVGGGAQGVIEIDSTTRLTIKCIELHQLAENAFGQKWLERGKEFSYLVKNIRCQVKFFNSDTNEWEYNPRHFVIKGLDSKKTKDEEFKERFHENDYDSTWPAVIFMDGATRKYCPLNYCRVAPFQVLPKEKIIKFEGPPRAPPPNIRFDAIKTHFKELLLANNPVLNCFGIKVDRQPLSNVETIRSKEDNCVVHYGVEIMRIDPKRGNWNSKNKSFDDTHRLENLRILLVPNRRESENNARDFVEKLVTTGAARGLEILNKHFDVCRSCQTNQVKGWLEQHFKEVARRHEPTVILFICDAETHPDMHDTLKYFEQYYDCVSQHVLPKTVFNISQRNDQKTLDNLVQKINIKAGGLCYTVEPNSEFGKTFMEESLIIGLDVNHPKTNERDGDVPSVVGMAANSGVSPYQFIGDFAFTAPKKEEISNEILQDFVNWKMGEFVGNRGKVPTRIVVFRDGVSEGQETEAKRECNAIENAAKAYFTTKGLSTQVEIILILIKKRHHTRVFNKTKNEVQNFNFAISFTKGVATYGKREFYIQAYNPIQGTAKVPCFVILRDDCKLSDKDMIQIIITQCNLHQFVDAPTSNPTPANVAHSLAERGSNILRAYRDYPGTSMPRTKENEFDWAQLTDELCFKFKKHLRNIRNV